MTTRFLAEDFRKLMDQLDNIDEIDVPLEEETPDEKDIEDLMKTDRSTDISLQDVDDIGKLIEFLDQFSELDQWRNHNAAYDDAFYENLPLEKLEQVTGLTELDIQRITDDTDTYEGDSMIMNDQLTVFGGD